MFFSNQEIDQLISDDVPYFDLTTYLLGIGQKSGVISYTTRQDTLICCTEEAVRVFERLGLKTELCIPSGTFLKSGTTFLKASGKVRSLHIAWRIMVTLLEYASGIATKTYKLVNIAKEVNPDVCIVTTRKQFPFGKKVCLKAIMAGGGAMPHRLGLSETVIIFDHHVKFYGGYNKLFNTIEQLKKKCPEKKIAVEIKDLQMAQMAIKAGVDILQLDKFSVEDVNKVVKMAKGTDIKIAAAGGINENNIKEYAATGVDLIVLTCPYFAKPADIKVEMEPI